MKTNKRLVVFVVALLIAVVSIVTMALADDKYVNDNAGVLTKTTEKSARTNLTSLEKNTGVVVRIETVKSLKGKSIVDYSNQVAKSMKTDKYAIFVVSVQDRKNNFAVGPGINAVFTQADKDKIASLPNEYFKKNDFDGGILKVGQAIDQGITSKSIKAGNLEVVKSKDGLSTSVRKKSYVGLIIFLILLAVIGYFVYRYYKKNRRSTPEYVDYSTQYTPPSNDTSHNTRGHRASSIHYDESHYDDDAPRREKIRRSSNPYRSSYNPQPTRTQTTVVHHHHHDNDNDLATGIAIGAMLNNNHSHHNHNDHRESPVVTERSRREEEVQQTSGNWNTPNTSDWDSDRNRNNNSYSNDDENKNSSGGWGSDTSSSWDSGSSYDSGSSDSSSGSDW